MKNYILYLLVLVLSIIACYDPKTNSDGDANSKGIDNLFDSYYQFKLRINPVEATKAGDYRYNDKIENYISDTYQKNLITEYTNFLNEIATFEDVELSQSQRISLDVMKWDCEIKLEGLKNEMVTVASPIYDLPNFKLMPVAQISSFQLYVSQLASGASIQPFKTVEDYENWLSRLDNYLSWLETAKLNMIEGMKRDLVLPKVLIERVIEQFKSLESSSVEDHLFFKPIKLLPSEFSSEDKERLISSYTSFIKNKLIPSYQSFLQFLINDYLPAGRESSGMGDLSNGPETYKYLIKYHTTTNMTPDEIFELGQNEVARIKKEMIAVKDAVGFEGDLNTFFEFIRNSEEQMPFNDPEQVIQNFNNIRERMKPNLGKVFGLSPIAGFEVRRTEAFREASASAEYLPGTKDGSRPGVFYVPIPDVKAYNKFAAEALFLHEAIPGHHYQLSLQQENKNLPEFLHPESIGVFVEGWALYAESLGKELGLYEDPIQYFGMLSMEMHRAIRLVVDAGIHAKGWTREQAIQFSLENEAESEAGITAEIERYMATPGQALSYKIGQLKIRGLRSKAEKALKDSFDVKEFHDQVLNSGSLPLVLLERKIDKWIEVKLSNQ